MRKALIILSTVFLFIAIGSVAWWREGGSWRSKDARHGGPPAVSDPLAASSGRPPSSPRPQAPTPQGPDRGKVYVLPEGAEISVRLNAKDATVQEDLEIVDLLISVYRKANHGLNPDGGLNDEIAGVLSGKNPNLLAVLPPDHPAFSKNGELLDRWGTPYYFHPITSQDIDLRSAGPDGALWTKDDVVLESGNAVR